MTLKASDLIVRCRLCKELFGAITVTHLRKRHNYKGKHPVRKYKRRFGVPKALCRDGRRRIKEAKTSYWDDLGKHWTEARVLETIRHRRRAGQSLRKSRVPSTLHEAGMRLFGSWEAAIEKVGLNYDDITGARRWTREKVIATIQKLAADGVCLHARHIARHDGGLFLAATRRFPHSWGKALQAAGFDPLEHRERRGRWDRAKAAAWMQRRIANRRSLVARDVPQDLKAFVRGRFKMSWTAYVLSFGVPYLGLKRTSDWSKRKVVDEIRRWKDEGHELNFYAVRRTYGSLLRPAKKFFGSWDRALRAAGLNPDDHKKWRPTPWTETKAAAWVRQQVRSGRSLCARDVPQDLRNFVKNHLGMSWTAFVEARGIEYPGLKRRTDWTKQKVLDEIRERQAQGRRLNVGAMGRESAALLRQAEKFFGDWDAACLAAGIGVQRLRPAMRQT